MYYYYRHAVAKASALAPEVTAQRRGRSIELNPLAGELCENKLITCNIQECYIKIWIDFDYSIITINMS
jgi:hypothetical protein